MDEQADTRAVLSRSRRAAWHATGWSALWVAITALTIALAVSGLAGATSGWVWLVWLLAGVVLSDVGSAGVRTVRAWAQVRRVSRGARARRTPGRVDWPLEGRR